MARNKNIIRGSPGNETIHYRYHGQMECLFIKDIAYIKSEGVYSMIYCIVEEQVDKKMICCTGKTLEKLLKDKGFIRCHKTYLFNPEKAEYFCSKTKIVSVCGHHLPVSARKSAQVFPILLEMGLKDVAEHNVNKVF